MLNRILLPSFIVLLLLKIGALNFTTFNLFGDEAQYWLWSKDIDFGYFSKPPFLSWIIRIYTEILGSSFNSLSESVQNNNKKRSVLIIKDEKETAGINKKIKQPVNESFLVNRELSKRL